MFLNFFPCVYMYWTFVDINTLRKLICKVCPNEFSSIIERTFGNIDAPQFFSNFRRMAHSTWYLVSKVRYLYLSKY